MPHPGRGFSQGLLVEGSSVWESVGNYGQSALRRYELGAGSVAAQAELAPEFFGEGICRVADLHLAAHLARADRAELGRRDA